VFLGKRCSFFPANFITFFQQFRTPSASFSDFCQKWSPRLSKRNSNYPREFSERRYFFEKPSIVSIFSNSERKYFGNLAKIYRHGCQNCIFVSRRTIRGNLCLDKKYFSNPYRTCSGNFSNFSGKKFLHKCQSCILRVLGSFCG